MLLKEKALFENCFVNSLRYHLLMFLCRGKSHYFHTIVYTLEKPKGELVIELTEWSHDLSDLSKLSYLILFFNPPTASVIYLVMLKV